MSKYAQAFLFLYIFSTISHAISESLIVKLHTGELVPLNYYQIEIDNSHQYIIDALPRGLNLNRPFKLILNNGFISYELGYGPLIVNLNNKEQLLSLNYDGPEYRGIYAKIVVDRLYLMLTKLLGQDQSELLMSGMIISIDADTGCNAVYADRRVSLFKGNNDCISSALSPTIIVHEVGHFIHDRLAKNVLAQDSDYKEATADILATIIFNTNIIGENFYISRPVRHLRDIQGIFNYAQNWRGTYSGSRIL